MAKLKAVIMQFEKALKRLEEALKKEKNEFMRDSAIKRFEMTYDLAWKAVKAFLEERHGIIANSPLSCFREAFRVGLIEHDQFWIDLGEMRNETVHTYQEELAERVYSQLPGTLSYFRGLFEAMQNEVQ